MAEFINKLLNRLGHGYEEDVYEDVYEEPAYEETADAEPAAESRFSPFRRQASKVVEMRPAGGHNQVVIMQPGDIEAAQQACDHIRSGKTAKDAARSGVTLSKIILSLNASTACISIYHVSKQSGPH